MLVIGKVARLALAVTAVAAFAGCSSADPSPEPPPTGPAVDADVATVRAALLVPQDIGPTWKVPDPADKPGPMVSFCGGTAAPPPVPSGSVVVTSAMVDEGVEGAQTLSQTALVFGDAARAATGLTALRHVADSCPGTVSAPAASGGPGAQGAFTETARISDLQQSGWSGFVVLRHQQYAARHPAVGDTAVVVLGRGKVLLVEAYAIFRLQESSASPQFTADWQNLVGSVLSRLGA